MATIIDSLLVTLGLDASEFNAKKSKVDKDLQATGSEADKTGAKFKKVGKDGADGFNTVASSAAKFLALIGGTMAVKRFIEQTVQSSSAVDRLSKNLQENVSTISAWSNLTELAGGSAQDLMGTLDMLSKAQTELQLTGQSGLIPYFSALGVSIADASGKARSGNDILLDLADRFSKMDRTTANNMGRMMGIDQGTMNLLLKGRKEIELAIGRQKEYGAVTKQQAEEASRLNKAMVASRQSFAAFGRELLSAATPALEKMFSVMADFGAWCRENGEFVQAFLVIIATGLAVVAVAIIPINLTVVAVTALAAAIAALWQDYQVWKRGGDSFIDWAKWEPGFKAASYAIRWLKDALGDIIHRALAASNVLSAVFDRDWKRAKAAAADFMEGSGKTYGAESPVAAPNRSVAIPQAAAMSYFQSQGWTKEQSAGIVANIARESSFNAKIEGDGGKAYGLAQWHPDRQAEFKKVFGKDIRQSSFEDQLAFIQYELTKGNERRAGDILRRSVTASEAAGAVSTHYERPADTSGEAALRGKLATQILGGIPGAGRAAAGASAGARATEGSKPAPAAVNQSVETHIGEVKVYSAATDADGIAKDIGKSLNYLSTSQANYGML